jgi:uncharacterized protein with HEPN domain
MSKREDALLVADMLEACERILSYTKPSNSFDEPIVRDAVARNLGIIGEASNRLSNAWKSEHPEVAWNEIRGFRNRLIHEYFGVDFSVVRAIVETEIPELLLHLRHWTS